MTMWQHWMVGQVDASIAAAVLLMVVGLARRRLSPRVRSAVLLIALVRLALPPWIRSPWSEALVDLPPVDDTRRLVTEWLRADVTMLLLGLTAGVSLFLLSRLVYQWRAITARVQALDAAPPELQARVNRLAGPLPVGVRVSAAGEGPFAVGLCRRFIVLPASLIEQVDHAAMEAVLAHEVAHHARRDLFWMTAVAVLKAVVWFNPLAHMIARALVATREDGSDDWAVQRSSRDPLRYARALLESARLTAAPHPLAAGAHPMGRRFRRLLDGRASRDGRPGVAGTALILLAAGACLPGAHLPDLSASDTEADAVIVIQRVLRENAVRTIQQR